MPELTLSEPRMIALAIASALVAGFVRGFAGFGGPALMILVLVQFYSPVSVLTKVLLIDAFANVTLLPSTVREVDWRVARPIIAGSVLGAPIGVYALVEIDPVAMKRAIAVVVAMCSLVMMTGWRFQRAPSIPVHILVGVIAGAVLGATYIALIAVIFLLAGPWSATLSRATIVHWGFITSAGIIGLHGYSGLLHFDDVWRSLLVGLLYLVAAAAGAHMFRRVPERSFRSAVLLLLLGLSMLGLLS